MNKFKNTINQLKFILLSIIIVNLGCEDNIKKWDFQVNILPAGAGLVVNHISESHKDTLNNLQQFDDGTELMLEAHPNLGWKFDYWLGDIEHAENPATLLKDAHKEITAVFTSSIVGEDSVFTIIAMGQSNMVGVGTNGGDLNVDTRVQTWNAVSNSWIVANPSNRLITDNLFSNYHTNHNNLAFHFAKQFAEDYDVEVRLLIVAKSGANIGQWALFENDSSQYDVMRNNLTNSRINEVDCILWHQGESNSLGVGRSYADSLQIVIDRLRSEPEISLTTPFIAGELRAGTTRAVRNDVYFNLEWFVMDEHTIAAILNDLPGIENDKVHFSGHALVTAGRERYYEAFQLLINN